MSPENVRQNVRELGTRPAETNQKRGVVFADSFGSCRLELVGVGREISFTPERSSVRIGQCPPCSKSHPVSTLHAAQPIVRVLSLFSSYFSVLFSRTDSSHT